MLNEISLPLGLQLRESQPGDQLFVEALFCSTREYFNQLPLPALQLDLLIKQQFFAQQSFFKSYFPQADFMIIVRDAEPIGKLVVDYSAQYVHVVDLVFLAAVRGHGYGTAVLKGLKRHADQLNLSLRLSVDQTNSQAKKLYMRLGFRVVELSETQASMVW